MYNLKINMSTPLEFFFFKLSGLLRKNFEVRTLKIVMHTLKIVMNTHLKKLFEVVWLFLTFFGVYILKIIISTPLEQNF